MRVLIYEPIHWGGHNLTYVRQLLRGLVDWPVKIVVATGVGAEKSEAYATQLHPFSARLEAIRASVPAAQPGADWGRHYYDALVQCIHDSAPDHVLIPTGDIVTAFAGSRRLRGGSTWPKNAPEVDCNVISGFYKATTIRGQKLAQLRTSLYSSYAPWTRTYTIDPFISVQHPPWRWLHGSLPQILPDPLDTPVRAMRDDARATIGLPTDRQIVGCVGHFASHGRKNPIGLIQGFLKANLPPNSAVALIVCCPRTSSSLSAR